MSIDLYKMGVCKCGLGFLVCVLWFGFLNFYYLILLYWKEELTFLVVRKTEEAEITERVASLKGIIHVHVCLSFLDFAIFKTIFSNEATM